MSEQILLQGKILGIEEFLLAPRGAGAPSRSSGEDLLSGRTQWITLLCEVLPRALLAELKLPRVLLGSSGGGQFLLVLPEASQAAAEEFFEKAAAGVAELSGGAVQLVWSSTVNLGDWTVVRRRLTDALQRKRSTPMAQAGGDFFRPFTAPAVAADPEYLAQEMNAKLRSAPVVGWNPEQPARILAGEGKYSWNVTPNLTLDGIMLARHAAPSDDGKTPASVQTLARRSQGRSIWGVLRGDADQFGVRMRRVTSIEEYVQLSVMYKQFFAGELEVLCSLPEFWRKATVLYSGGDDFAVFGSWDALIALARELQRLFHRFTEENLKDFPGAEGKTISMALALAPEFHAPITAVYQEAGRNLEIAKSTDKDCIYLLGRVLEWKQLSDAAEMKDTVTRLMNEFRSSRQFLNDLRRFYQKESAEIGAQANGGHLQSVWKFQRRFNRILSGARSREFQKLRAHLISEVSGRKSSGVKLRPAGLVALEWARLAND